MAQMITQTPAFYGKGSDQKGGLTPEDFISRVDDLQRTNNWGDDAAAHHVQTYLNGPAREWFTQILWSTQRADYTRALASYEAFKEVFVPYYFSVTSTFDLSSDWHNLKQNQGEDVQAFYGRVVTAIAKWHRLFDRTDEPDQEFLAAFVAARDNMENRGNQGANADAPRVRDVDVNALNLACTRANANLADKYVQRVADDLTYKVLANGVRSDKIRELVRRRHKLRDTPLYVLLGQIVDLENTIKSSGPAPVDNKPKYPNLKMGGPTVAGLEEAENDADFSAGDALSDGTSAADIISAVTTAVVSALKGGKSAAGGKKNNKKSSGKKSNGTSAVGSGSAAAAKTTTRYTDANGRTYNRDPDYFLKQCGWCEGYGHIEVKCKRKPLNLPRGSHKGLPTPPHGTPVATSLSSVSAVGADSAQPSENDERW
jgi:Retrotransposon gag protein